MTDTYQFEAEPDGDGPSSSGPGGDEGRADRQPAEIGLSTQEITMLELVAAGHSHTAAGEAVNRSAKTVQRLLKRAEARAFVAAAQGARLDEIVGKLAMAAIDAAQVVQFELEGESDTGRLRAAALIFSAYERLGSVARRNSAVELRQGPAEPGGRLDAREQSDG